MSAALINAANAAQFHNFEALDLTAAVSNLDVALMTNSTLEALTLSGNNGAATVSNVAAGVNLLVSGENSAATTINVKDAAIGTADAFSVAFNGTGDNSAHSANVVVNGIENLSVESAGMGSSIANTLTVTDGALQNLTITGDKALTLDFKSENGAAEHGMTIDGSAATGALTIDTTSLITITDPAGLTVKTGSADDTITLNQKATVDAGAGDDTIIASAKGGTFTGGVGNDTFDVSLALAGNADPANALISTVTDFSAGDTLKMITAGNTFTEVTLTEAVHDLASALTLAATTENITVWFQYGGDTYIVANDVTGGFGAGDLAVKLTGTGYNFDGATLSNGELHLA